jgi:hypothetical protein
MDDRSAKPSQVGMLLKEMALRASPAFPDFSAVFNSRKHAARKTALKAFALMGVLAFGIGTGLLLDDYRGFFTQGSHKDVLIEAWSDPYGNVPGLESGGSEIQKEIGYYLSNLWTSSWAASE